MRRLLITLCLLVPAAAHAGDGPKVPIAAARKTALARVPGTIEHEKLKHKHGFVYAFKIHPKDAGSGAALEKVEVDGDSGKVIQVKAVSPKDKGKDKDKDDD